MQRHNALKNFLAHHARCSGAAVHIEQKTTQDVLAELGVTAEDGTRAKRPLHTADVHIFDTQARQVWLDVRVTVPPSAAACLLISVPAKGPYDSCQGPELIASQRLLWLGYKIQGTSWGQQKRRKPPFRLDPRFEWLEVA